MIDLLLDFLEGMIKDFFMVTIQTKGKGQDGGYANLFLVGKFTRGKPHWQGSGEAWNKFKGWVSPSKRRKTNPSEPPELELPAPTKSTRPELPTLKKGNGKNSHKDKLAKALVSARMLKNRQLKAPSIEKDFCAASSKGAKDAKKRTIDKLLTALNRAWTQSAADRGHPQGLGVCVDGWRVQGG